MATATQKAAAVDYSRRALAELVKPGDTLYTVLRHKSTSGMQRVIDVVAIHDGKPLKFSYLGFYAAQILGLPYNTRHEGVTVGGCGMDMGFHLVSSLSRKLYGDDYALNHRWI